MVAYPDTLVGTDSHTTMVNGAAVLGWGVGGIEAEAAMLGQPISMLIPEVVGFELTGQMVEGTTGTDLVLKVVEMLREKGVVGKFVEFYGAGLDRLPLATAPPSPTWRPNTARPAASSPSTARRCATCATPAATRRVALVEAYAKENGFWRGADYAPVYTDTLSLDMGTIVPAISGPKRPQDYVPLTDAKAASVRRWPRPSSGPMGDKEVPVEGEDYTMESGKVVIASITSCTNTSNPYVMIGAGLVARKAAALGLDRKPWVKTSLAPGAQVVTPTSRPRACRRTSTSHRLQPRGLWLHHLHRQLRPAAEGDFRGDPRATWSPPRSCRATATSRAGSARTCAPTTSPRRRWWWPMRWPARWTSTCHRSDRADAGRQGRLPQGHLADPGRDRGTGGGDRHPRGVPSRNTPMSSRATRSGRASR
jgi:hypothetical protein